MTTNYTDYKFTANGVNFISRIHSNSPFRARIESLPAGAFAELNIQALTEIIGDASLLTRDELVSELERVNAGGSHAFIMLDEAVN